MRDNESDFGYCGMAAYLMDLEHELVKVHAPFVLRVVCVCVVAM